MDLVVFCALSVDNSLNPTFVLYGYALTKFHIQTMEDSRQSLLSITELYRSDMHNYPYWNSLSAP